jgi:hypothetical protein
MSLHAFRDRICKAQDQCLYSQPMGQIHMARRHNPYVVVPIRHWDFIDFKEVQNENFKNMERDINDDKVRWRDIVHL